MLRVSKPRNLVRHTRKVTFYDQLFMTKFPHEKSLVVNFHPISPKFMVTEFGHISYFIG